MRHIWLIYLGLIVTAPPAAMGALMLLFHCINPMAFAFVTQFDVVNQSGEAVTVTPLGVTESGRTAVLPQFATTLPALPRSREEEHPIAPGGRLTIRYDWDDISFSELRVRGEDRIERVLPTDPLPTTRGSHDRNRRTQYVIPPLNTLPPATTLRPPPAEPRWWIMTALLSALFLQAMFWWLLCRHNPRGRPAATQSA